MPIKSKRRAPRFIMSDRITIGRFHIIRTLKPDGVWITNEIGEGMMTDEARLARAIGKFYADDTRLARAIGKFWAENF